MLMTKKEKDIKLIEFFGGIGSPRKALENIGFNVDSLVYVDNNQSAVSAYNVLFNENYKTQDIKEIISLEKTESDLLVFGSPCTDFSTAGKQDITKGNSILYMEVIRLIEQLPFSIRPKFIIWENVKALISKKFKNHFEYYVNKLKELGYNSTHKILNAKNFGIPQNRERIFTVSIKKSENKSFNWEKIRPLECRPLKSFLHSLIEIDSKLWFTNEKLTMAINKGFYKKSEWTLIPLEMEEYTNYWQLPRSLDGKAKQVDKANGIHNRYWKDDKTIGALSATKIQNIIIPIALKKFNSNKRIRIPHRNFSQTDTTVNTLGITPALLHNHGDVQKVACQLDNELTLDYCKQNNIAIFNIEDKLYAIRHLSYIEYWRLMGWKDSDIKKVGLSKSKMYFLPGNAISIPILESISQELLN